MNGKVATIAPRTQAHVYAKHKAIGSAVIEQANDALPKAGHKAFVINTARAFTLIAIGLALPLMDKDKVNVAREVQLMRAQLTHRHDRHLINVAFAFGINKYRIAVLLDQLLIAVVFGKGNAAVRKLRQLIGQLLKANQTERILPYPAHHQQHPQVAQPFHHHRLITQLIVVVQGVILNQVVNLLTGQGGM